MNSSRRSTLVADEAELQKAVRRNFVECGSDRAATRAKPKPLGGKLKTETEASLSLCPLWPTRSSGGHVRALSALRGQAMRASKKT